jgi:N-6 DNA Methylase
MSVGAQWLFDLEDDNAKATVDGLVLVESYSAVGRPPEEVATMEKARAYRAHSVFFEASLNDRPPIAQAFVYISTGPQDDAQFGALHRRLWSWGGVPLIYRKAPGLVQLFRCAHRPDFEHDGRIGFYPFKTLELASEIAADPWWDAERLRNGTLWDDPGVCKQLLSNERAAQKTLINAVRELHQDLTTRSILRKPLRRRLLILSVLIAYLEARKVFEEDFFARFLPGARRFFEVLADGAALLALLESLETRFNGNVFVLNSEEREVLRTSNQLARFAQLIEGRQERSGQLTLWQLYSFEDLPVELISHIYQLFVTDAAVAVYTPHFVVRLMLSEVLSWERLDRLEQNDEVILDGACGSGIFLVEAYKRLVLHWRYRNDWKRPGQTILKKILTGRLRGVDVEEGAVELAAFSLCLALCDALEPMEIRASVKLFPPLKEKSIHTGCFFETCELQTVKGKVGIVVGNPPFASQLSTEGARRAYERYQDEHGSLPDKQLAYLFLHVSMELLALGGVLSMLQQYNFLYNQQSLEFRRKFIERWDVREILDFISVRGLFQKGDADTKVVVVVAEARRAPPQRQILHATFRRTGRTDAEQGFDLDYYDMHWLPRELVLGNDGVWRGDLLGGGRVLEFADRLKKVKTLGEYAREQGWDVGEGFIAGTSGRLTPGPHITGHPLIEPRQLTGNLSISSLKRVAHKRFKSPYTSKRFQAPMVLVHEHEDLTARFFGSGYFTYGHKIVGFCSGDGVASTLLPLAQWFEGNRRTLSALVCAAGTTMFTQRASSVGLQNILALPSPEHALELSVHEQMLVDDIVDYYRDLIRLGEDSTAMSESGVKGLASFNDVFTSRISGVFKDNALRALNPQIWPGVVCQPYVFGQGKVNWSGADELRDKVDELLREKRGGGLQVTRIARLYDGPCIYLLKPNRLRFWLRSVALRDADEALADLAQQGF